MKFEEYLKTVTDKISDQELKSRFTEELNEHWEDYCEQNKEEYQPEKIFGSTSLLAFQINSVTLPNMFFKDLVISVVGSFVTLALLIMLSSFLTFDLDSNFTSNKILSIVMMLAGSIFWCGLAWYLYLFWHRRLLARYGRTTRRTVLLLISFAVPCFFLGTETLIRMIGVLISNGPLSIICGSGSELLAVTILNTIFFHALRMVYKKIEKTNRLLVQSHRLLPLLISAIVTIGSLLLIVDSVNENVAMTAMIFTLPLLMAYLCWGLISITAGFLLTKIGWPLIFGFWCTVIIPIVLAVVAPIIFLIRKKSVPLIFRLLSAAILPLILILPFIKHDVPKIEWQIPVVWSWKNLEKTQLNITYPWAAPLMRRNDGTNVQYRARVSNNQIVVIQAGGKSYTITRGGVEAKSTPKNLEVKIKQDGYSLYNELPTGFSCDDEPLENFINTHENTTGPLGMFGIGCSILKYNDREIAKISNGSLIDLDLTDNGLLAVSINMGSYDPTYVYVVDLN